MFGIGEGELLIIVAFGFMIFGPDKLPGMGRTIGRALRQFRQAQEGFTEVVQAEVMDPLQEAMGDPLDTGTRKDRRATAEQRAAALAQDADREDAPEHVPAHKETFAERKARLAAERKAQQEAAAEAEVAEAAQEDTAENTEADAAEAEATRMDVPAPKPAKAAPKPADTSAAALYAMGGRSSFAAAKQQAAEEAAAAAEVEPAVVEAPATTDGKEERDA